MPAHQAARLRLVALWVAVAAHAGAGAAVVTLALKIGLGGEYALYQPDVLASWLALSSVPALILSPLIGALARSQWSRLVLAGSASAGLLAVGAGCLTAHAPWLGIAAVVALGAAFFGATVIVLLPAAADAARLRLPSVLVGVALALFAGLLFGFEIGIELPATGHPPPPAGNACLLLAVAIPAALLVRVPFPDPSSLAHGLFRSYAAGVRDAVLHRRARRALAGLTVWALVSLVVVVAIVRLDTGGPRVSPTARDEPLWEPAGSPDAGLADALAWFGGAVLAGVLIASANRHPYRHAWLVPLAASVGVACALWWRLGGGPFGPLVGTGLALGATFTPLLNAYLIWTVPRHHGAAAGLLVAVLCGAALLLAAVLPAFGSDPAGTRESFLALLVAVTALAAVGAWFGFMRPLVEGTAEILIEVMYRARAFGPGVERLPTRGPCLVIANHAAWLDPLWLSQVVPAPTTPMMTSKFYDLPVLAWLMRRVIGAIRVPDTPFRHEAPELLEAVKALDRGDYLLLFPEGYLRRKEEVPLRRFGRGVWKILSDRPQTPVFACWIEGGWGSYFSFRGGPPTRNKRPDFRRLIRIAVTGPFTVEPAVLADHMATRTHLMERVNAARPVLGLEPLDLGGLTEGDKE